MRKEKIYSSALCILNDKKGRKPSFGYKASSLDHVYKRFKSKYRHSFRHLDLLSTQEQAQIFKWEVIQSGKQITLHFTSVLYTLSAKAQPTYITKRSSWAGNGNNTDTNCWAWKTGQREKEKNKNNIIIISLNPFTLLFTLHAMFYSKASTMLLKYWRTKNLNKKKNK